MNRADFQTLVRPFLKLGAIVVASAAVVVAVGLATAPAIQDKTARAEADRLKEAAGGLLPGSRYAAFPLTMSRSVFDEQLLKPCPNDAARRRISACYEMLPDDTVVLKRGLPEGDRLALSLLIDSIGYRNEGAVRAYYPIEGSGYNEGYLLELQARCFGGDFNLLARFGTDGVLRNAVPAADMPAPGPWRERATVIRLLGFFIGAKGAGIPVTGEALPGKAGDAVTGASVTFRGLGIALREGSRFVSRLGGY